MFSAPIHSGPVDNPAAMLVMMLGMFTAMVGVRLYKLALRMILLLCLVVTAKIYLLSQRQLFLTNTRLR